MLNKTIFKYLILVLVGQSIFAQDNIRINEILTSNINGLIDTDSGEYYDWIELYNPSDSLLDISGYYLTDDINNPTLWQFPSNTSIGPESFLIIWADSKNYGLHTNFKLNSDGEQLLVISPELEVVDSISFGKQRDDVSFGRDEAEINNWLFYGDPTPRLVNSTTGVNKNKLSSEPEFSVESGFYSSSLSLELTSNDNGKIYYSLDGSIPYPSSATLYLGAIIIDKTTIVRAISVEDNQLRSNSVTNSYFINENTDLPVMSVTTDPKNLWDDETGIYTIGTNGIEFWSVNANYWQDWERPVKLEFFEENKSIAFKANAGIAINGARRNMLQKSLRLLFRNKYGDESINYKIFPDKENRNFNSLVLRNGGFPEFRYTLLSDGFMQRLISQEMEIDYQAYRPCALYLNGKYWGIYNIREKQNEDYLKENNGVDPDNLDILEDNMTIVEGDRDHYKHMIDFVSLNDLSLEESYDSVKQWMDVDNYINYQIAQLYFANTDWPANNIKYWRSKTSTGKWKWMIFDVDGGFGLWGGYDFNSLTFATEENSSEWNNPPWSTFLFRNLLKNQSFVDEFAQRFATYLSYSFNSNEVTNLIDRFEDNIENEIPNHINRWAPGCSITNPESKDGCVFSNIGTWYSNVDKLREFAEKRPQFMTKHLMDYFSITDTVNLLISSANLNAGTVYVNGVRARFDSEANVFVNKRLVIEARPNPGYRFVRWNGFNNTSGNLLEIIPSEDIPLEAVFESIGNNVIPAIINHNLELTKENSPYSANGDVYVYENSALTIQPGVEINMPANGNLNVFGGLEILGTKDEPVKIKGVDAEQKWGALNFINAKQKSIINHARIIASTKGKDILDQLGGVNSYNSDIELNYVTMDSVQFPIFVQYGNFVMRNSTIHTEVTSDFINVKYGTALIENSDFIGNKASDTDAIDYDDVESGIIRRNKIHGFYGDNSDAIDIGEEAKNILIEDNLIYNCSDKGISIGQQSTAIIRGNIISNCNLGVGIKDDQSYGFIDHNTFYNNNVSVSCYEKILGRGGGKADITNTILSKSNISDIFTDDFSEINIKYSLSDSENLIGEGNQYADPGFLNIDSMDFRVMQNSPAIDNGDPDYTLDPNGTRTDIGASYHDFDNKNELVISEINYNSNTSFNPKDWIELFNPNDMALDLSNWIFKDSNDEHRFIFPVGTIIGDGEYLVLSEDSTEFGSLFPGSFNLVGNFDFGLNNSGEKVRLFDNYGNVIDSLTFDDNLPWPVDADGDGYTLQLLNHELENSSAENWTSTLLYGSPGQKNVIIDARDIKEEIPHKYSLSQNYPNPFNPVTTINFELPEISNVSIKIYDILGREVADLVNEKKDAGSYSIIFETNNLSSGIYFYRLSANEFHKTNKMILLK
jgi:CotH kinase protein/Lamin Tail Domain/Secretion system C-terminal sorting domain/Chitobiase/beta-hexosaminidase C-terminal domain/Right handed beta helix region